VDKVNDRDVLFVDVLLFVCLVFVLLRPELWMSSGFGTEILRVAIVTYDMFLLSLGSSTCTFPTAIHQT